jgi:hypothetical protein
MLSALAGAEFAASVSSFPTGLSTVGVQIFSSVGVVVAARSELGVVEVPPGSGTYTTTLQAPAQPDSYLVFWDQGTVSPTTSWGETLAVSAAVAAVVDPKLLWLRRLIGDLALTEAELITAPGGTSEFFVSNPPIAGAPTVSVGGVPQTTPGGYSYTTYSVSFPAPPSAGSEVVIRYGRTTFDDVELESYVTSAMTDHGYVQVNHIVYRAAISAIDTLLVGAATSLDFGSGQETFSLSSVFTRLMALRAMFQTWLENDIELGDIQIGTMRFDSLDPGFPGGFDPNSIDYSNSTPTGAPPGMPGAFIEP